MSEAEKQPDVSAPENAAAEERPSTQAVTVKGKSSRQRLVIELVIVVVAVVAFCVVSEKTEYDPWCRLRAYLGSSEMQYVVGKHYLESENPQAEDLKKAEEWLKKADEKGHPDAALRLADLAKNDEERLRWTKRAADNGNPKAQYNLGMYYFTNLKYDEAVAWHEKAAALGLPEAQHALAGCYRRGDGVKQDIAKAKEWYEKAAAQGYGASQNALDELKKEKPSKGK